MTFDIHLQVVTRNIKILIEHAMVGVIVDLWANSTSIRRLPKVRASFYYYNFFFFSNFIKSFKSKWKIDCDFHWFCLKILQCHGRDKVKICQWFCLYLLSVGMSGMLHAVFQPGWLFIFLLWSPFSSGCISSNPRPVTWDIDSILNGINPLH